MLLSLTLAWAFLAGRSSEAREQGPALEPAPPEAQSARLEAASCTRPSGEEIRRRGAPAEDAWQGEALERIRRAESEVHEALERIKRARSEVYEKLIRLREEDLDKFRALLEKTLAELRAEQRERDRAFREQASWLQRPPGPPGEAAERVERVMDFLREFHPGLLPRAAAMREDRPWEFERLIDEMAAEMRDLEELRERDPRRFELTRQDRQLERESRELAANIRDTHDPERADELRERLRDVLVEAFDARMEMRRLEAEEIRRKLARLERMLDERMAAKERIVERRMRELLGEGDEWAW